MWYALKSISRLHLRRFPRCFYSGTSLMAFLFRRVRGRDDTAFCRAAAEIEIRRSGSAASDCYIRFESLRQC